MMASMMPASMKKFPQKVRENMPRATAMAETEYSIILQGVMSTIIMFLFIV